MREDKVNRKIILFFFFIFNLIINSQSFSQENKILVKIENEIITSIDIKNETKYLMSLNDNIKNLNKKEIFEISKRSIIREKIKKIEVTKSFKNINVPEKYLEEILKNVYSRIGIKSLENFKEYLEKNNVKYTNVKNKIKIEALWNELIYAKFLKKIKINKDEIRNNILSNKKRDSRSYFMSEIFFEISNSKDLKKKYSEIKKVIEEKGFDNAALRYSSSNTANIGGKLGWIKKDSLNQDLKEIVSNLKVNEHTQPISVPGGFLILQIDKIKDIENNYNIDEELKKIINSKKNDQLNQYSKIYYNKIKKNIKINEL